MLTQEDLSEQVQSLQVEVNQAKMKLPMVLLVVLYGSPMFVC
jgi:hypoxanthine-guanine phosphoribosyltransferase